MAIDTTVKGQNANSYGTTAEADDYFSARGNGEWLSLSEQDKEIALIKATDYLEATYFSAWIGVKCTQAQALAWPRIDAYVDESLIDGDSVPEKIKRAQFEMALRTLSGELIADQTQKVIKEKVDVLEVEYYPHSDQATRYDFVNRLLLPFLKSSGSGSFQSVQLVRN